MTEGLITAAAGVASHSLASSSCCVRVSNVAHLLVLVIVLVHKIVRISSSDVLLATLLLLLLLSVSRRQRLSS